ncbi:MAG TPA: hypothetical protein VGE45_11710 [Chloroflexia bacterium]
MIGETLASLQGSFQSGSRFATLADYFTLSYSFLSFTNNRLTRIVSPTHHNYIFYQYGEEAGYKITRPLNTKLFIESPVELKNAFDRFFIFLADLKRNQGMFADSDNRKRYINTNEINKVVYTLQQALGSIGDSLENANQSRKRAGQLFEGLVKLIIQEVGLECEPRRIRLPIPDFPGYVMPYELDLVFSRNRAIITSETGFIYPQEVVGSVKLTSKDRIDKVFLDKYLLARLLGRSIPVIAIFLHDVQRARRAGSNFGINSTFKTNHFLGYTVALNKLDGVYYVDPRPEMVANERLREQIFDFQQFLVTDLWRLSSG